MSGMVENLLDLLTGFAYLHIGIVGIVGCFLAGLLSAIVWSIRAEFAKSLPGTVVVVLVPLLMLGAFPGLEVLAVPVGLIATATVAVLHVRRWKGPRPGRTDAAIAVIAGVSLAAIALAFILGSLSAVGR